jgi:hypothetical protein
MPRTNLDAKAQEELYLVAKVLDENKELKS